jgi:hypothetical protein
MTQTTIAPYQINSQRGSVEWIGIMVESQDTWPLPDYNPGQPKHLHAVGVIAVVFAQLERSVESLYHAEALRKKMPDDLTNLYFYTLNEEKRIQAIRQIYNGYNKIHPEIVALIGNLLDYFNWCRDCRNHILHAENYPAAFGGKSETLYLTKRIGKQNPRPGYIQFTLPTLRSIADRMRAGVVQSATIEIRLRYLGVPLADIRQPYLDIVREPFPQILPVPRNLKLNPQP